MSKLKGRVAIVTGSAMGMGYGVARVMAGYGAKVELVDSSEAIFDTVDRLRMHGYEANGHKIDVRDTKEIGNLCENIHERFGKIDILVNAAGIGELRYFLDASDEMRDYTMDINFKGTWNLCKAVAPYMIKAKYGKIVNFGSVTGIYVTDPGMAAYAASKGAILAFTKALAVELAFYNIMVNAILPGMVDTPMTDRSCQEANKDDPQSVKEAIAAGIPMKRLGTIEEAGEVAAFLASNESNYVTGTHIVFDGGSTLPETPGSGWKPKN